MLNTVIELLSNLTSSSIPAVIPKPTKPRIAAKCAWEVVVENEENGIAANGSGKRRRTNPPTMLTPVKIGPFYFTQS